ncbi:MAG: hypothetical protein KIT85_19365 [Pseudolabrys sp.]|nr:hypothetical protein [Pseudolabrys sp.]
MTEKTSRYLEAGAPTVCPACGEPFRASCTRKDDVFYCGQVCADEGAKNVEPMKKRKV